jgi:hypothetical protein
MVTVKNRLWPKYTVIIAGMLILIAALLIVLIQKTTKPIARVTYHGPNPNMHLTEYAASTESAAIINSYSNSSVFTIPQPQIKPEQYGIAAGGGLTYLDQDDLNQYFQSLQELGVTWVRWDIDWSMIQPDNSGSYDWSDTDRVASTATRYGINSLAIIDYAPKWAANPSCNFSPSTNCAPASPQVFGNFAETVAARYKGEISYFEIWNEPNYTTFWEPKPNVKSYAEDLKEAYEQIKIANPQAVILSGGLAATDDDADGSLSPATFTKELYSLGANKYFDAIALHPYTYPATPNFLASWSAWQQMAKVRQIMVNGGDSSKKIWITEYGAPTGGPGTVHKVNQLTFTYGSDYMSEDAQSQMLTEAASYYKQNTNWMGAFFWYTLRDDGSSTSTPENFFGLLRYSGSQKPAFGVFESIIKNN